MTRWLRVTRDGTRTLDSCEAETIHEARWLLRRSWVKGSYVTSDISHRLAWTPKVAVKLCINGDGRPIETGESGSLCKECKVAYNREWREKKRNTPSYKDRQRTWRESKRRAAQRRKEANG